jgi:cell division transport system permease protein
MATIHIKSAWDHVRRSPFQALAAVLVLTITFFVSTVMAVLVYSSGQIIKYFETRPQVIAFLKDEVKSEEIVFLQNKIQADSRVGEVKYVSKEEALEIYKNATSDNPLLSELVSPSIFPASLEVSLTDLTHAESVIEQLRSDEIVDQVGFTASLGDEDSLSDVVKRLRDITWYLRIGGGTFAILLTGTSFLVLIIIIGMRMSSRRDEIEILDLIGATAGFVRSPIIIEAILYAVFGVILGWIAAFMLVLYSTPTLILYFGDIAILPRDTIQLLILFGVILAAELLVGLFLALAGSIIALSRVRRKP